MAEWLVGVDIGGTFTDLIAVDPKTDRTLIAKVPSTPQDPALAVLNGVAELAREESAMDLGKISFLAHGTTVATNAVVEAKGARAGLLITRGTRAVYEAKFSEHPTYPEVFDIRAPRTSILVPQKWTEEVTERLAFDGSVLVPLDEESVRRGVRRLRERGVQSIAVCYLFSFLNPAHEVRTAKIVREEFPGARVSLSSDVVPVIREYHRLSTTALDAYVGPIIESYLRRFETRCRDSGITTKRLYIMQSNGGLMNITVAARNAVQTVLSGPTAGVVFGARLGELLKRRNIITLDIGGTSADIGVIKDFRPTEVTTGRVAKQDLAIPMTEIRTLGAGGGTIAWIGKDGLLKVGPQSAGAEPGPACYDRGGELPTVTDANLLLGYLDPAYFLGGKLSVKPERAQAAIEKHVASPLGMSLTDAAAGIVKIVNTNMEVELRLALFEKGLDPRQFALVAFGGAGPTHAGQLARDLGISTVIVPRYPGISCAMGLLMTDVKHFYLKSRVAMLQELPLKEVNQAFANLAAKAREEARFEGFSGSEVKLTKGVDLRYIGQGYEITVPCPAAELRADDMAALRREFDRLHRQIYGHDAPDEDVEVVTFRLTSIMKVHRLKLERQRRGVKKPPPAALRGRRDVFFAESRRFVSTPIFERGALRAGNELTGPAIVEQLDTTTVIHPGQTGRVDEFSNIVIAAGINVGAGRS
jgi:N-methylhydantoinase A